MGIVVDNAANNFTAIDRLKIMLPVDSLLSKQTSIRCFCHILNLVVKVGNAFILVLFSVDPSFLGYPGVVHEEAFAVEGCCARGRSGR